MIRIHSGCILVRFGTPNTLKSVSESCKMRDLKRLETWAGSRNKAHRHFSFSASAWDTTVFFRLRRAKTKKAFRMET